MLKACNVHPGDKVKLGGVVYCGFHACQGGCGLPAAYAMKDGKKYFVRGSMAARGMIMQCVPQHPDGEQVDLRELFSDEDVDGLFDAIWS